MFRTTLSLFVMSLVTTACAPTLSAPSEAVRIRGEVTSTEATPVRIGVFERCSKRLFLFEECPGRFLAETKIARPGAFLVEVDTESPIVTAVALRGPVGREYECVWEDVALDGGPPDSVTLELQKGACGVPLRFR